MMKRDTDMVAVLLCMPPTRPGSLPTWGFFSNCREIHRDFYPPSPETNQTLPAYFALMHIYAPCCCCRFAGLWHVGDDAALDGNQRMKKKLDGNQRMQKKRRRSEQRLAHHHVRPAVPDANAQSYIASADKGIGERTKSQEDRVPKSYKEALPHDSLVLEMAVSGKKSAAHRDCM